MCDTMIAMGALTASGRVLLAKNSDREANEAQYLTQSPAADHAPGAMVRLTYVSIPQVAHTHALVGSRPWWMWGFEHGVNEHGLAIGNEAVWSRLPAGRADGVLGMDLLRLTLERAATADEGLAVLTALLEAHGQSGRCSVDREMFYHNAFILADAAAAWVVETAGPHWVARRVSGWASISNVYSIGTEFDLISDGAVAFAVEQGWHDPTQPFDWAAAYTDTDLPDLASCRARHDMAQAGMGSMAVLGGITHQDMFQRLRDHGEVSADWRPALDGQGMICMHAYDLDSSETVAAMVAELGADTMPVMWSALASPCLSSFVPVWVDAGPPPYWQQPTRGAPDAWWLMERLQRQVERDYAGTAMILRDTMDLLQDEALAGVAALPDRAGVDQRRALTLQLANVQHGAVAVLGHAVASLQSGSRPPRQDDPRGSYLADVAEHAPDTSLQSAA